MLKRLLRRDDKGIGAVEFALVAPVLISFVIGISQMGKLFFANADMRNAIAAGARVASVWPVPDDAAILAAVNDRLVRTGADDDAEAGVSRGTDDNDNPFVEISMTYSVPLDFIFFEVPAVTLADTRRVFVQVAVGGDEDDEGGEGGTSASSTSASSTSASSTGGSTGTSSTTSSSGTSTSTTSASTTSSGSSGNGSSGNNNGSSGHAHGNCSHC